MGERIELPMTPAGTPEEQLRQMYSYLYRVAEALNHNLSEIGDMDLTDGERMVMQSIIGEDTPGASADYAWQQKESLKSLIIKTATFVQNTLNEYRMNLLGEYIASGKFGEYVRNTSLAVDVTPTGITQDYTFQEVVRGLQTYKVNAKNYIKTGLLRTVNGLPVYGVAIGKDVVTFAQDGTETYNDSNKVAELTADELSFYQGGNKIASYSGTALKFYTSGRISFYNGSTEVMYIENNKINVTKDFAILSGGKFDVTATNFSISSTDKEMITGNYRMNNDGIFRYDGNNYNQIFSSGYGFTFAEQRTGSTWPFLSIPLSFDHVNKLAWLGESNNVYTKLYVYAHALIPPTGDTAAFIGDSNNHWKTGYIDTLYATDITATNVYCNNLATKTEVNGKKPLQTAKTSPTASGSTTAFIDTISQDANGVITATKKNVSFTGYKTTQTAKSSPTASGYTLGFIDTISQDANGVITATKKTVDYNDLITMVTYTYSYTLAAGSYLGVTGNDFNISTPTGYTPVAVASSYTGSSSVVMAALSATNTGTSTVMGLRNVGTASVTQTAGITILYMRNHS